ncbi:MAG: Rpn family recombination-promoting nuclease/putative transposase [Pseudomonadales bacterium]
MAKLTNPPRTNDDYLRAVVSVLALADELVRFILGKKYGSQLSDDSPELLDRDRISAILHNRRLDGLLLYRDKSGNLVLVPLEHKSRSDPNTYWQVAQYMMLLWDEFSDKDADGKPIGHPAIYPIVLHQGKGRWTAPRFIADRLNSADPAARQFAMAFDYILWELLQQDIDNLPVSPALWSCLATMAGTYLPDKRDGWIDRILSGLPEESIIAKQTYVYILNAWEMPADELTARLEQAKPGGGDIVRQAIDEFIDMGRVEGEAKGEVKGKAALIVKQLQRRFGSVDPITQERVTQASPDELDAWGMEIFDAKSLDDIFKPSR